MKRMGSASAGESVVITDTWTNTALYAGVHANKRHICNENLPPQPRGIYIGGVSGMTYNIYVMETDGSIVGHLALVPGVVHPIFAKQIINTAAYATTAINLIVKY